MSIRVHAVNRSDIPAYEMPDRFRRDVTYFMTPAGERGAPSLAAGEFWINREDVARWLEEGVLRLVSPLDSTKAAEVEITEEQENWLQWLAANEIEHIRLETLH
jgi:hypothetical protein